MLKAHSRVFEQLMLVGDLVLIAGCWIAAYVVRFYFLDGGPVRPFRGYALQLVPILIVWGFAFKAFELYRPHRLASHLSEWFDIAKASSLGVLVLIAIMTFVFHGYDYSRVVIAMFWAGSIVAISLSRAIFREAIRVARRHGYNQRHALIVGSGELPAEVLRVLRHRPDVGVQVLGVLTDREHAEGLGARWLGAPKDLRAVLDRRPVDMVIIAFHHAEAGRISDVLNEIGDDPVAIHFVPDIFNLASLRGGVEEFEGVPFIHLRESPLYGWNRVLKRAMDVGIGVLALAVAAPVMLGIAAAIRLTSRGPVLYRQERMGLDGRRFAMLKFRTMRVDAERETGPQWAEPDDPRRTALGGFLRRWSLDELPQLWNVLKGEMSLVGPRPERPSFVEEFRGRVPGYMLRHKVKAGLTGWAQVNGWRGNTSLEKRIEYDLYYIERWSIVFDLRILLLTLWQGFRHKNAY